MSDLKTRLYTAETGVEITISWTSQEDFKLGTKFLTDMGVLSFPPDGEKPASFYLETEQQLESLYQFRRALGKKTKS